MQMRSTKITIFILLSIFAAASSTSAQQKVDSPVELSPTGKKAFDILISARRFEDTYVGYGGELSKLVAAYREILKEPKKVEALKFLLEKGSKPGQLYALAGLYDSDYTY